VRSYDSSDPVVIAPLTAGSIYRVSYISATEFALKLNDKLVGEDVRFIRATGGGPSSESPGPGPRPASASARSSRSRTPGWGNNGTYTVSAVDGGRLTLTGGTAFTGNLVEGVTALTGSGNQKDRLTRSGGGAARRTPTAPRSRSTARRTRSTPSTATRSPLTTTGSLAAGTVSVATAAVDATFDGDRIALVPSKTVRGTPPSTPPAGHQAGSTSTPSCGWATGRC
jgi:hypothetical protein